MDAGSRKHIRFEELPSWDEEAGEESHSPLGPSPGSSLQERSRASLLTILAVFIATIVANAIYDTARSHFTTRTDSGLNCGTTVEEAQSKGCVYDVMANAWTPQECYFPALAEEFLTLPNSTWYYDDAHEREIPLELLQKGEIIALYPHWTHHDRHCLYTWRKLSLAAEKDNLVDTEAGSVPHTKHCTDYMAKMGQETFDEPRMSRRKFIGCIRLGSSIV